MSSALATPVCTSSVKRIIRQLILQIIILHEYGKRCIVHGDIGPPNIMISKEGSQIYLIDWDLAAIEKSISYYAVLIPAWVQRNLIPLPPEIHGCVDPLDTTKIRDMNRFKKNFTRKVDIWLLGDTLFNIIVSLDKNLHDAWNQIKPIVNDLPPHLFFVFNRWWIELAFNKYKSRSRYPFL